MPRQICCSIAVAVEGTSAIAVPGPGSPGRHIQVRRASRRFSGSRSVTWSALGDGRYRAPQASWGALTLGVDATHAGSLNGALLAVLALVPLAAFELSSPLPAATQALQRSRVAAARVFEAMDAPAVVNDPQAPVVCSYSKRIGDAPPPPTAETHGPVVENPDKKAGKRELQPA